MKKNSVNFVDCLFTYFFIIIIVFIVNRRKKTFKKYFFNKVNGLLLSIKWFY